MNLPQIQCRPIPELYRAFHPRKVPSLKLWYSARHPAFDAYTYGQAIPELFDWSGNGWNATQATGTARARFLTHDGRNYLRLPGIAGNGVTTPDSAALDITGDIDLVACAALNNWASGSEQTLIGKAISTSDQRSYRLFINGSGAISLQLSADGTLSGGGSGNSVSTVTTGFAALSINWVRATWRQSNGQTLFYTSSDGQSWAQLGAPQTRAIASIYNSTSPVEIGSFNVGISAVAAGRVLRAQIYNGINGTLVADFDPSRGNFKSATIGSATGETWTLNRSGLDSCVIVSARAFLPLTDDYYDVTASAAGVLQNVSGGTMLRAGAYNTQSAGSTAMAISTATANLARMVMGTAAAPSTSTLVAGRRLDANSVQTKSAALQNTAYGFSVQGGRLDYSGAKIANFTNGVLVATEDAFQTAGPSENTASARMRIFSDLAASPGAFHSGPVTDIALCDEPVNALTIRNLSRYFAAQAGVS